MSWKTIPMRYFCCSFVLVRLLFCDVVLWHSKLLRRIRRAVFLDSGLSWVSTYSCYLNNCKDITKTCQYNFVPLKPHVYIVKLGFTEVYIINFLISAQNIDCMYALELPHRGGSNEYPHSVFWTKIWRISDFFFIWKFSFFCGKVFHIFE